MDEVLDELKANNPETREKGERIINDFVQEARQAAEKFGEDFKNSYSDVVESATDFIKKKEEAIKDRMGKNKAEDTDDVWGLLILKKRIQRRKS